MAKKSENPQGLQELKKEIREKTPGRLYVFFGEETFLLQHYLGMLRKLLVDELTESFNYHKLTPETFDMRAFADAVENLPMMAERTMVWVDEIDLFKLNETDRTRAAEILGDIPEYCTVVFTYNTTKWNPDKRLKKLWDAIERNGKIVEFPKQEQRDLIAWVSRHFAAEKKRISPELCSYLIDITGGTMTALSGEISKIVAYSGADTITKSDIDTVTEPVLDAVVFQMTDHLSAGNCGAAMMKLHQLLAMQQEPLGILGAIGLHFRRLGAARTLLDNGKNSADMTQLFGISEYAARRMASAASRFGASFYARAMELILETDHFMKTSFDTPDRLLEVLILHLSQEIKNA